MKVAKRFRWEAAHRLTDHPGACKSIHGHSYEMTVILSGDVDENGMVVEFADLKAWMKPLVDSWDHATLVYEGDSDLRGMLGSLGMKMAVLPFESTSENLCRAALAHIKTVASEELRRRGITDITIRLSETETCFAELTESV